MSCVLRASFGNLNYFIVDRDCRIENHKSQDNLKFIDKDSEKSCFAEYFTLSFSTVIRFEGKRKKQNKTFIRKAGIEDRSNTSQWRMRLGSGFSAYSKHN